LSGLLQRRQHHRELLAANERLRQGMDKKRELAALVVHDLRNPLAAIHGNAQLLLEDVEEGDEFTERSLRDIEDLSEKALSMVAGLLDVEELEEGLLVAERAEIDVADFVSGFPRSYRVATEARKLQMHLDIADGLCGYFDHALMGRVVENLLDNAVRYAPRGGLVALRAFAKGSELCFEVGNNGPPIAESEHERIFGRYYRLEARRAGARANRGLGLYFCKLAAEAHRGSIEVAEREELPACFVVRLPDGARAD
jgi:signal transduction histidine kinase